MKAAPVIIRGQSMTNPARLDLIPELDAGTLRGARATFTVVTPNSSNACDGSRPGLGVNMDMHVPMNPGSTLVPAHVPSPCRVGAMEICPRCRP